MSPPTPNLVKNPTSTEKNRTAVPSLSDMEDSWENWLPHLVMMNGDAATSFEEIISFNDQYSSDSFNGVPAPMWPKYSSLKSNKEELGSCCSAHMTPKRALGNHELEARENRGTKKGRSSYEAQNHIMSERKRRQEMAEKFIALSATIPGLKKIDKASVLQEAINYVKQLQERIAMLEKETNKVSMKSLIIKKSHLYSASCETNSNDYNGANEVLPEVEARGLEKEVLIRIHCEKRKGIILKILALLESIHLTIASSSILPFGNSTLNIIIIAQMSEKYNLTVNDLVKTLKQDLLKLYDMQL